MRNALRDRAAVCSASSGARLFSSFIFHLSPSRLLLEAQAHAEVAAQQVAAARAELARQQEHGRREVAQLAEAVTALQAQVTALVAQGQGS